MIAWLSLVQVDLGKEQPVDLEDWSAHKVVTIASLAPGQAVEIHLADAAHPGGQLPHRHQRHEP